MAAQVAALSGVLAAAAAAGQAGTAEAGTAGKQGETEASGEHAKGVSAESLGDLVRVNAGGGCGCAPCWGPPAPPAMRGELLALFEGEEVAA